MNDKWDALLEQAFVIIEKDEKNKRRLWELSYEIRKEMGTTGLHEFSANLKERFGITRSYNTLRQYAYTYEVIKDYDIPEDIPYTTLRTILSSDKPLDYIRMIQAGASSFEVMRLIITNKPPKSKATICRRCGKTVHCPCENEKSV